MFSVNQNKSARRMADKKWVMMIIAIVVPFAVLGTAQAQWAEMQKLLASDGGANDYFGHSVSISGRYAIVGAYGVDDKGEDSGSAYIYERIVGENWSRQTKVFASNGDEFDGFGLSVSISGDYAIVGAPGKDASGRAYIFKREGENWVEKYWLLAFDRAAYDIFGHSVSISGDYAIVGAPHHDDKGSDSGSAYIFKRVGENWVEKQKLLASDGAANDWFGRSVSISGDYAIVGADGDDDKGTDSGSAYIFKREGENWVEKKKLLASDGAYEDYFGDSVSISGDYAIVGAVGDDDKGNISGSAYIFKREGENWVEKQKLLASDGAFFDYFGDSVSISGDYAIVGASSAKTDMRRTGSAYIFKRNGVTWVENQKLFASDGADGDDFGGSVSISGNYAIVGASGDNDNGWSSGSSYIFDRICSPADLNGDCFVNFDDFALLASQWLTVGILAGTFQMGDSFDEGDSDELPVHTVQLLYSFYIDKYEITNGQYCQFLNSALGQGLITVTSGTVYKTGSGTSYPYCYTSTVINSYSQIDYSGGIFSVHTKGGRSMANDPMVCVTWYGAAAYCNWRSQQEGKEICYNTSEPNWPCDFNKKGYRLPTEAEWEYAARGGLSGKRFPWGDTISPSQANYFSFWEWPWIGPYYPYDLSTTRGSHPLWKGGDEPYTSPVGFFDGTMKYKTDYHWPGSATSYQTTSGANNYDLYDMAGNVGEWCNDWYSATYYSSRPTNNPTGPVSGSRRVNRGGSWSNVDDAFFCRVAYRNPSLPTSKEPYIGFRCVLALARQSAEFTGDGVIDFKDFAILVDEWLQGY